MLGEKVPLQSLDTKDWLSKEHLNSLENYIGKEYSCAFSSVQAAIHGCLDLVGTRTSMYPVLLPVTSPPDTLSAVLRAGAQPFLLDIDEDTLQMQPKQLKEALEELETAIVLLNRPAGQPINPKIEELVLDQPTIVDSRMLPHPSMEEEDLCCTFNVFDLTSICGSGGVVVHKFQEQVSKLKIIRSGIMGHSTELSELQAAYALGKLKRLDDYNEAYQKRLKSILEVFSSKWPPFQFYYNSKWPLPLYIRVTEAPKAAAQLNSYGVEALLGVYPLYKLDEVNQRYKETPDYPVAEKLSNEIICLPTNEGIEKHISQLPKIIKEVT